MKNLYFVVLQFSLVLPIIVYCNPLSNKANNETVKSVHKTSNFSSRITKRIITDYDVITSPIGMPLDFSFNETKREGSLTSAPGCPKSIDGYPWVYYGNPPRCFLVGFQGPCSYDNRVLSVEKNSTMGICGCKCFLNSYAIVERLEIQEDTIYFLPSTRYRVCPGFSYQQVYDTEGKQCYNLDEQGPCIKGEWLVKDRTGLAALCVPACPDPSSMFYDWENGRCATGKKRFGVASVSSLVPSKCTNAERYSTILKKCVTRKGFDKGVVLG